jgi:monoterpene epsilon-lactone hydrolase
MAYRRGLAIGLALALLPVHATHASVLPEADGTVQLGPRSVPLPQTISPEARAAMSQPPFPKLSLEPMRAFMRQFEQNREKALLSTYQVRVEPGMVGATKINTLLPADIPPNKRNRVLLHIHGGGFSLCDAVCSYSEGIPIAGLTRTKVVSVDYRLAPEHPFPSAVDEILLVYKSILKSSQPSHIGIFGSSAGAILSAEVTAKIKQAGLPLPAAMEFLSGTADFAREGDSQSLYDAGGFSDPNAKLGQISAYLGSTDPKDPIASPVYSDLRGFPPTLLMTSTRDLFLSGTVNFERQLHAAGVRTELVVFDAMTHTFWLSMNSPEAFEALQRQADFFDHQLGRSPTGAVGTN